ncbi:MAG: ThiF family adenylyltransferase [Bacteroidetes bacterium]|nr:MAG: ThiF family adenylyltransferase [Bacteroidota bacterium]
MKYTVTILESHYNVLKSHLLQNDGKERVAFIICGRSIVVGKEDRFLSREVILISDSDLLSSTFNQVTWDNNFFIKTLKQAETNNFGIIVIHNHPQNFSQFSSIDDNGEKNLFKLAFNRNGGKRPYASLIMLPDGTLLGRVWKSDLTNSPISFIRVIGKNYKIWYPGRTKNFISPEAFNRQQLAFGKSLIQDFSKLKITIIGAGATGSSTALLLTRLGIGEIVLIDKDTIQESNLNRLHGAKLSDVGAYKVDVLKQYIKDIGLGTKVKVIKEWISGKRDILDQLKTSDLIFGCTDDNAGRILLNRFAYFYLIPVIDMGLVISVKNNPPEIQNLQGRISFLFPGGDCLITKGNINIDLAYSENLKRNEPENYWRLKKEAYVVGEGNPAPAVVTFTTQIATIAVNELLNRFLNFNPNGLVPHKIFFFHHGTEIFPSNIENNECRICGSKNYWGRGDMLPFLDLVI